MIIGHKKQIQNIENQIKNNKLFHAYLFVGERHLGKTTIAKFIAEKLQGSSSKLDLIEILGRSESIKIKDIKILINKVQKTKQSNYKIIIIQNIERLTLAAANSFLKTLEEPPEKTIFFLTTENLSSILQTITSRVRIINFYKVDNKEIQTALETLNLKQIQTEGKPGLAIKLAKNEELQEKYKQIQEKIEDLLKEKNIVDRFKYIEELTLDEDNAIEIFLNKLKERLRQDLIQDKKISESILNNQKNKIQTAKSHKFTSNKEQTIKKLLKIEETGILIGQNINTKLALENLMLEI